WLAWLIGHSVLVVPLTWSYLVDGYAAVPYDVRIYAEWGAALAAGEGLPAGDDRWQYPPGAAVVFALPAVADRLVGLPYPLGFVAGMLLVSAAVTAVLLRRRSASAAGLWAVGVWAVGQVAVARFDLVPAAFAVLAILAAGDRQWARAGWAAGVGALAKAWPVIPLAAVGRVRRRAADGSLQDRPSYAGDSRHACHETDRDEDCDAEAD
nr:hypothetical protein [Micromonospora sp. DSM 115978]